VNNGVQLSFTVSLLSMVMTDIDPTVSNSANQNCKVERLDGTFAFFWSVALLHAVYLKNRLYHRSIKSTPIFAWTSLLPNLAHLRIFGLLITARLPGKPQAKLDRHTATGIFTGYDSTTGHIKYYDLATEHFKTGNHFVFDEAHFNSSACSPDAQLLFDLGLDTFLIESPPLASVICFASQPPLTKLKPGITNCLLCSLATVGICLGYCCYRCHPQRRCIYILL
jgi:hypothetical protein